MTAQLATMKVRLTKQREAVLNPTHSSKDDSIFRVEWHHVDGTHLTAQYFLVVDALNFCFWPGTCQQQPPQLGPLGCSK
jgi:hypothetical protein